MILEANLESHCYDRNLLFKTSSTTLYDYCTCPIVPEYSFLDARGLGAYEGKKLEAVSEVIFPSAYFPE